MTCIVWSKGILAADRNVAYNDLGFSDREENKLMVIDEYLIGFSGRNFVKEKLIRWIKSNFNANEFPTLTEKEDFDCILINGKLKKSYLLCNTFELNEYPYDHDLAIGSLGKYAQGALIMGADARTSINCALLAFPLRPEAKFLGVDSIEVDSLFN